MNVFFEAKTQPIVQGRPVQLVANLTHKSGTPITALTKHEFQWGPPEEKITTPDQNEPWKAEWTPVSAGPHTITLSVKNLSGNEQASAPPQVFDVQESSNREPLTVTLAPSASDRTNDDGLFQSIRESTEALDFNTYLEFTNKVMCQGPGALVDGQEEAFNRLNGRRSTVFPGVDAYQRLKVATEFYLMLSVGVLEEYDFAGFALQSSQDSYRNKHGRTLSLDDLKNGWLAYLGKDDATQTRMLPIDKLVLNRLGDPIDPQRDDDVTVCEGLLQDKLRRPCFFELIWSYWHEEGMLVQTLKSIAVRFQNKRTSEHDPLASFDVAPLYPLSNLLWGYIQDEQHRLTLPRRAYEYDHHYGLSLEGKAIPPLQAADSRSKFLEAFHNLLHGTLLFYKQDDDTTKRADAFPVLNGLKEVHLLLREGMHNQFGDLPSTARIEMLMEQWILARPEMKTFLGGRGMMPYSEAWMDRVDTMKKLKGWTDVSVTYFNELAKFGEQLLLSIRHGDWSNLHDAVFAAHWAREWRPEVQQYVHAYRTVTGVDLSPQQADVRLAADRYVQPSVHLRRRLDAQKPAPGDGAGFGSPRTAGAAAAARNGTNGAASGGRPAAKREQMEVPEEFQ